MKTISDLPRNLVGKILSMVPITCLGAVRCTCKGWNALSKVRILCKAETRHQFVGFMMKKYKLCSVRFDLFDNEGEFVDPSVKELGDFPEEVSKVFQCDGLLLCSTRDNTKLVLWNPYLGQTRWIQPRSAYNRFDNYAIGYDNNGLRRGPIGPIRGGGFGAAIVEIYLIWHQILLLVLALLALSVIQAGTTSRQSMEITIMTDSRNRWLTDHELNLILQNANSLTVSTPSARNGSIGLFLYNVEAYRDDMLWQHFDGGNPHRGTLDGVRYTESTNFVNEAYRRRVHRRSQRHGILAVVHYRIV